MKFGEEQFKLLTYAAKLRAQLERSVRTAIVDLKQSQKERKAQPVQTPSPRPPAPSPGAPRAPLACAPTPVSILPPGL